MESQLRHFVFSAGLKGTRKRSMTLTPGKAGEKRQSKKGKNPARTRLRQSGSVDDAAAVFFDMIE